MFRQIAAARARANGTSTDVEALGLASSHPVILARLLEEAWNARDMTGGPARLGRPDRRSDVQGLVPLGVPVPGMPNLRWEHLIYAYMIENTRIVEIFRRVVHEFVHGERLGIPKSATQNWLRNTEQLFFRDPVPFAINAATSHVRPDERAARRNAYHRMFGMDLNHGSGDGLAPLYIRAEATNSEFVSSFEDFLREVWVGLANAQNTAGANPTDDARILNLVLKIEDMLLARRNRGNLAREEFTFVATLSWFHMTVEHANMPVLDDLGAVTQSIEQRLFAVAERVKLPAHGYSRSYFEIAEPMSTILTLIENGALSNAAAIPALYRPVVGNPLPGIMQVIISHWSNITGRDLKGQKLLPTSAPTGPVASPARPGAAAAVAAQTARPSTNGPSAAPVPVENRLATADRI